MKRTFELFKTKELNSDGIDIKGKMIKYEFKSPNAFACYNGQPPVRVKNLKLKTSDFEFEEIGISPDDLAKGADAILWEKLLVDFVPLLLEDLKTNGDAGWKELMKYDKHTSRSYLGLVKELDTQTINWLETVSFGTGWFDQGLAEMVLESIAFGTYKDAPKQDFWCLK